MIVDLNPFPELETDRLVLRKLVFDDRHALASLRSNKSVNKYLDRADAMSVEEAEAFIKKIDLILENKEGVYWAISLKDEGVFIGAICFWNFKQEQNLVELGYELHPAYQGKGLMQEAMESVIEYGFSLMQLNVITALPSPENERSTRLLEKNDFKLDKGYKYVNKDEAGEQAVYYLERG